MPKRALPQTPILDIGMVSLGDGDDSTGKATDVRPPSWITGEALALWESIANSHYCDTPGGIIFKLPIGDELSMAWELYTYGGCSLPNLIGVVYYVTLIVEGDRIPKFDAPPERLGHATKQTWRKLYVRGKGLELTLQKKGMQAEIHDQYLAWARNLQLVDAAVLTESREKVVIRLIPEGGQVMKPPASAGVVAQSQRFYSLT